MKQKSEVYTINWCNTLSDVNHHINNNREEGWNVVSMVSIGDTDKGQVLVVYEKTKLE
jgi:hypothetical protein